MSSCLTHISWRFDDDRTTQINELSLEYYIKSSTFPNVGNPNCEWVLGSINISKIDEWEYKENTKLVEKIVSIVTYYVFIT